MFSLLLQVYKTRSRLLLDTDLLNDIEADLSDLITNCILEIIIITFLVTISLWMPTSHDGLYQGVGDWNLRRFELSEQNCSSSRPAELGHNGTTGSQQSLCVLTFLQSLNNSLQQASIYHMHSWYVHNKSMFISHFLLFWNNSLFVVSEVMFCRWDHLKTDWWPR